VKTCVPPWLEPVTPNPSHRADRLPMAFHFYNGDNA
jgi:hypothetical protein